MNTTTTLPSRSPSFFIVGAAKAGTTSLWDYLGQHPQIFMTKEIQFKELGYYCDSYGVSDRQEYSSFFSGSQEGQLIGEACTAYLSSPESASRIKQDVPDAKIIIMLRDPVKRAYSLYSWMSVEGYEPAPTFESALEAERKRLNGSDFINIDEKVIMDRVKTYYKDYFYFNTGIYFEQIRKYFEVFGRENCFVILLDDLKTAPFDVLTNVFNYLGVDPSFKPKLGIKNKGMAARFKGLQFYLKQRLPDHLKFFGLSAKRAANLQQRLLEINSQPTIPPIKEETELMLRKNV